MLHRRGRARLIVAALGITLPLLMLASPVQAATAGAACKQLGATLTTKGVRLTCVKSGRKLVWRVQPQKATSAPTPSPTPTPTPSATATPTSAPVIAARDAVAGAACTTSSTESFPIAGPLRCTGGAWTAIARATDSIASRAFRSLVERYSANAEAPLAFTFVTDPSGQADAKPIELGMLASARLWNAPATPNQPYPVLIGRNSTWLRVTVDSLHLQAPSYVWTNLSNQETPRGTCSYAQFFSFGEQPWYLYCFGQTSSELATNVGYLQVGAHEYTHLAQYVFYDDFRRTKGQLAAPWFQEGFATYVGTSLGTVARGGNDLRSEQLNSLTSWVKTPLSDYAREYPADWNDIYPLAYFATEALIALFGIGVMETVLRTVATGKSFDESMRLHTGRTGLAWVPILQGYIDSCKAGAPWTLSQLEAKSGA